jgi:rhodanese-related sulfurtransferase
MVDSLRRDDVRQLMAQGAQLVEVLPAAEYDGEHVPGAVNVPL